MLFRIAVSVDGMKQGRQGEKAKEQGHMPLDALGLISDHGA
jgi:hypothetical protein